MAETTFDLADSILKDFYWGSVFPQMITDTPMLDAIKTSDKGIMVDSVGGRQVVIPVRRGGGQGLGARSRGQALPNARRQLLNAMKFPMKKVISRVQIEGEAWRATEGAGKKAFVSMIVEEIDDALQSFSKDLNQQLYNDGTGKRTTVSTGLAANPAGGDITVVSAQWISEDMEIDVYSAGAANPSMQNIVVTAVDRSTGIVSLDQIPVDISATDEIYRAGNKGNELMGLEGIVQDASGLATLQNITISTSPWFRATVLDNAGSTRPLTLDLMENIFNAAMSQDNVAPDLLVCDYTQKKAYKNLLTNDVRFVRAAGKPTQMDGGAEALSYNNVPFIYDVDCQSGRVYALKKAKYLRMFQQTGYQWISSPDKKNVWDRVTDRDSYEAVAVFEGELACLRRNVFSRVEDLE